MKWGALVLLCLAGQPVLGQPTSAPTNSSEAKERGKALFLEGQKHYKIDDFPEAIRLFQESYIANPVAILLFNIGQAYRQVGDCQKAVRFYEKYLQEENNPPNLKEVRAFIAELTPKIGTSECRPLKTDSATTVTEPPTSKPLPVSKPPASNPSASNPPAPIVEPPVTSSQTPVSPPPAKIHSGQTTVTAPAQPATSSVQATLRDDAATNRVSTIRISGAGGPSFSGFGTLETSSAFFSANLQGSYFWHSSFGEWGVGPFIAYSPIHWKTETDSGNVNFVSFLLNATWQCWLGPQWGLRADIGVGIFAMTGLVQGNPFLDETQMEKGSATFFHLRAALGLDFPITDRIFLHGQPAFSWSPLSGLREDLTSMSRFELVAGVGIAL